MVETCLPGDRHGLSNGNSIAILAAYIYTISMNYEWWLKQRQYNARPDSG